MKSPKQSLGDSLDRLTILARKVFFGEEDAYKELNYIVNNIPNGRLLLATIRLNMMNVEIWNLENEIRKCGDPVSKLGLEEIGRRAMMIRDYNKKRIQYKNDINEMDGSSFKEFKIKHRSQ